MKAVVFPGQGAQFVGMGKELYESNAKAKALFDQANEILGYKITDIMFAGTDDELKQTKVTQPAVFLHSVISAIVGDMKPEMVGGHSLGEFSALVASGALRFEDGLKLVYARAMAMQKACELKPSTMAAIIGLPDEQVEAVCQEVSTEESVVVPANYNCPGQLVISGDIEAVEKACEKLKEMGAKRALVLPQKGVGHSPNSAEEGAILGEELKKLTWHEAQVPIYQDADGLSHTDPKEILDNQIKLMTCPVQWTNITFNMVKNGVTEFYECGTDDTLQKIVKRMTPESLVTSILHCPSYDGKVQDFSIVKE